MTYYYCILPSGNASEFPQLDAELRERVIDAHIADNGAGRIYRIHEDDLCRLPFDENGPYLGTDNSGHSLYKKLAYRHNKTYKEERLKWVSLLHSTEVKNATEAS